MVRRRVLYGSLMIAGMTALMAVDAFLSRASATGPLAVLGQGGLTALVMGLIALGGAVEMCRLARRAGHRPTTGWCLVMVALFMLAPWLASPQGRAAVSRVSPALHHLAGLGGHLPWIAIVGVGIILVLRQRTEGSTASMAVSLLVVFYTGCLASYAVNIRCWLPGSEGAWLLLATLAVIKISDISAYFTGLAFGKTPLIPKVSPKKTWEGTIGGVLGSGLAGVLLVGLLVPALCPQGTIAELRLMQAFVFGIVMSVAGQFGDLVESLFKRDCGAKDSAKLVPDFGGILDLIDSPLFALPVAWALLRWWTQAA